MSNGNFEHLVNFWTHGVNTIVEYPDRAQTLRRAGWGTLVEQPGGTENWFHIPLHTPNAIPSGVHDDINPRCNLCVARIAGAWVKANLNANAAIRELHLRAGQRLIASQTVDLRNTGVSRIIDASTAPHMFQTIEGDGIALCVKVVFLEGSPAGQVIFYGAGSYFNHG